MSRSSGTEPRRIDAAHLEVERGDLLIHALAQLPDTVTLELPDQLPDRAHTELLARAYGILDRVSFGRPRQSLRLQGLPPTMAELIQELSAPGDPPAALRVRDEILAGHRLAIVTNLPAPYRLPLFGRMSRRLERAGAEFRVFFLATQAHGRPWIGIGGESGFEYESLASFELPLGGRPPLFPVNLEQRLSAFRPTIVLAASFSPFVSGRATRYARRRGAVFGIWSGEIAGRATARSRIRRIQRKHLVRKADFAIAYGFLAGEYLRGLRPGLPHVYGRNSSDAYGLERKRPPRPQTVRLLAVADMAKPGKGVEVLVDALETLPGLPCCLTVVGPGAGAVGLEERARGDERIRFVGALPKTQVRERYAESDVFLFPSGAQADPFGLALVEAMGSGLASIASSRPGVVADLAVDDENCVLVRDHTPEAWAHALQRVVPDHDLRAALGERAATTIRNRWTMDHACDSMIAGLRLGLLVAGGTAP